MQTLDERKLTPQQIALLEQEKKSERSLAFREELDDYHDAVRAEEGGYDPIKAGRFVPNNKKEKSRRAEDDDSLSVLFQLGSLKLPFVRDYLIFLEKQVLPVFSQASAGAVAMPGSLRAGHAYEDDKHVFDTMMVSQNTARALERESRIMARKLEEIDATQDPVLKADLALKLERMAEEFQMQCHPITKMYVHDLDRILKLEERNNTQKLSRQFEICIVRVKDTVADTTRKMKVGINDAFDDGNAAEVKRTVNERMAAAPDVRPILPDGFHYTL